MAGSQDAPGVARTKQAGRTDEARTEPEAAARSHDHTTADRARRELEG